MPTVAQLMQALPEPDEAPGAPAEIAPPAMPESLPAALDELSLRGAPVGRLRRMGLLATLQAKIGAAYLFYWIRGWFAGAGEKERLVAEAHWKAAARLLDSMSYLRGAVMKVGQTLANFPDIAPQPFVETLERLHFDAPPMHWSLLREMVHNELGDDPERLFAAFETRAFAAASLGQVHRATLQNGTEAAVKIQYPGIARTIRDDLRNLQLFLLPARLDKDWEYVREQFDELRIRLEQETDYEAEAAAQTKVRSLFREDEGIIVPQVYPQWSTARVLSMERIGGVHLEEFVARGPTQDERNAAATKLVRAWYRMLFAGRLQYVDFHPGNVLFLDDGRVGLLDFGMMLPMEGELWEDLRLMDRAMTTGDRDDRIAANKRWCDITDAPADADRLNLTEAYADWCWRPRYCGGEFDFGDEADFRRGIDLFTKMVSRRYARAKPSTPVIARSNFGWRSLLYRLKAKIDIRPIAEEEVKATGWDRGDYA
ncbi:MAG TPA: AarF/ABC1/UbiB kinase family protein [Pirellulales bacterium]|nr:AarF/ABC1/UbiB kinase family protein [Pirellulales bacterium]